MSLLPRQCQRHNSADVHIWPVDVHVELEFFADGLDVLESLLEVGTGAADPDLDIVLDKSCRKFSKSANDTFECRCNLNIHLVLLIYFELRKPAGGNPYICKVGNTTTNKQNLALRAERSAKHEI